MDKKNNIITHELITNGTETYISEIQHFHKPEDYEDAFKKYYPKEKSK